MFCISLVALHEGRGTSSVAGSGGTSAVRQVAHVRRAGTWKGSIGGSFRPPTTPFRIFGRPRRWSRVRSLLVCSKIRRGTPCGSRFVSSPHRVDGNMSLKLSFVVVVVLTIIIVLSLKTNACVIFIISLLLRRSIRPAACFRRVGSAFPVQSHDNRLTDMMAVLRRTRPIDKVGLVSFRFVSFRANLFPLTITKGKVDSADVRI